MRQKQLISPELPLVDRISEYRVKASFRAHLSSIAVLSIVGIAIIEAFAPILSAVIIETVPLTVAYLLFWTMLSCLCAYCPVKFMDIVVTPTKISAFDFWYSRQWINWEDIAVVKLDTYGNNRIIISIESTNKKKPRSIILDPFYYDTSKIFDRVRDCAGVDHPLTLALSKELYLPRQKPFKLFWKLGSSLLSMLICAQIDSWQGIEPKTCCC
jgi:hypothetical protein